MVVPADCNGKAMVTGCTINNHVLTNRIILSFCSFFLSFFHSFISFSFAFILFFLSFSFFFLSFSLFCFL